MRPTRHYFPKISLPKGVFSIVDWLRGIKQLILNVYMFKGKIDDHGEFCSTRIFQAHLLKSAILKYSQFFYTWASFDRLFINRWPRDPFDPPLISPLPKKGSLDFDYFFDHNFRCSIEGQEISRIQNNL